MKSRWIIHYNDGHTVTSDWDSSISFVKKWSKLISSMQLQEESGKLYTLSANRKQTATFWQRDTYKNNELFSRSILKRLYRNIWLELKLLQNKEKPEILIIKDKIEVPNGNRK